MAFQIKKAERKQVKIKIGVSSPSGFGKTYSSLLLAKGLCGGDLSQVCVIDTENDSASLYADLGDYSTIDLEAPFTPERYIDAIKTVCNAGFKVCIIDSISHSWDGTGGFLEIHDEATKAMKIPNSFMSWSAVTPRYKKFMNAILQSDIHVICCSRRKQEYEQSEKNGRKVVQKIGTKEINRDGFEYELSINFDITNENHYVFSSKDRTNLFPANEGFIITEETGKKIKDWIESGVEIKPIEPPKPPEKPIPTLEDSVFKMLAFMDSQGVSEEQVLAKLERYEISQITDDDLAFIREITQTLKKLNTPISLQFPTIEKEEESSNNDNNEENI